MGHRDGQRAVVHAVQEDIGRGVRVRDSDHARPRFVLLGEVRLEGGPALGAGDDALEAGEELAPVADAQGEGVLALEEGAEFGADFGVEQDGGGPAAACAENVACGWLQCLFSSNFGRSFKCCWVKGRGEMRTIGEAACCG